jgi:hypothetical protein
MNWVDGMPWADSTLWDPAKAEMCAIEGIDVIIDDSPIYGKYFDAINTIYVQVHNPNRKVYQVRKKS